MSDHTDTDISESKDTSINHSTDEQAQQINTDIAKPTMNTDDLNNNSTDNLTKPLSLDEAARTSSMTSTSGVSTHSKKSSVNIYKTNTRPLSVQSSDLNIPSSIRSPSSHSRTASNTLQVETSTKDHSRTSSISEQLTHSLEQLTMELQSNHSEEDYNDNDNDNDKEIDNTNKNDDEVIGDTTMSAIERIKTKQEIIKQMANESRTNSNNKLSKIITNDFENNNVDTSRIESTTPLSNPLTPLDLGELPTPATITETNFHTTTVRDNVNPSSTTDADVSNNGTSTDEDEDRKNYRNSVWLAYDQFIDNSDENISNSEAVDSSNKDTTNQTLPHSTSEDFLKSGITDDEFLSDDFHYDSNSPVKTNGEKDNDSDDNDSLLNTKKSVFLNSDNFRNLSNSTMNVVSEDNTTTAGSRHNGDSDSDEEYSFKEAGSDDEHELEPVESSGSLSTGRYSRKSSFVNNTMTSSINNRTMSSSDQGPDNDDNDHDRDHDDTSSDDYGYNENHSDSTSGDLEADRREMFIRKNTMQTIRPDQVSTSTSTTPSSIPKYGFVSDSSNLPSLPQYPLNTPPIRKYSSLLTNFNEAGELSQAAKDRAASLTASPEINPVNNSTTANSIVNNANNSTFGTQSRNVSSTSTASTSTVTSSKTSNTATSSTTVLKPQKNITFVSNDIISGCNIIQITSTKFSTSSEKRFAELNKYRQAIDDFDTGLDQWLRHTSSSSNNNNNNNNNITANTPNVKKAYSNISSSNQLHHHQYVSPSILTNSSSEIANELAHDLKRTTSKVKGYFRKIKNSKF